MRDQHNCGEPPFCGRPGGIAGRAAGWSRVRISKIEDLGDGVLGAGLEAVQLSRGGIQGSLAFAAGNGVVFSSGAIGARVAIRGSLSPDMVTLGVGLRIGPGSRHWLTEVQTGTVGAFFPGDEHDSLYTPDSFYAAATLKWELLEERAAGMELVLNERLIGGTGLSKHLMDPATLAALCRGLAQVHDTADRAPAVSATIGDALLDAMIAHLGRAPQIRIGGPSASHGYPRIVERAREYIYDNLDSPLSVDAIARAANTSRRTLFRAFHAILDETPYTFVQKLRLHRIRNEFVSPQEARCTVAIAANRWGVSELGRLAGWYRELFGELPSATLRRRSYLS